MECCCNPESISKMEIEDDCKKSENVEDKDKKRSCHYHSELLEAIHRGKKKI